MPRKRTRKGAVEEDQSLIDGQNEFLMGQPLQIGRQSYAPQDVIDVLAERVASGQRILDARTALTAAIKADQGVRARTKAFVQSYRAIVQGMFKDVPDMLAVFGLVPPKQPKVTVAVKVEAIEKSKATRAARGTMGKKQRKRLTGKTAPRPPQAGGDPVPAASEAVAPK